MATRGSFTTTMARQPAQIHRLRYPRPPGTETLSNNKSFRPGLDRPQLETDDQSPGEPQRTNQDTAGSVITDPTRQAHEGPTVRKANPEGSQQDGQGKPKNNVTIGILGKSSLTPEERDDIFLLGVLLYKAGRDLITTEAEGVNKRVVEGYESAGGTAQIITKGVFDASDAVFVYPDKALLSALTNAGLITDRTVVAETHERLRDFLDKAVSIVPTDK